MKLVKRIVNSKYFMAVLWAAIIIVIWEIFAFIVQYTKRTPVNILPHLTGIIESIFSQKTINGSQMCIRDSYIGIRNNMREAMKVYGGNNSVCLLYTSRCV